MNANFDFRAALPHWINRAAQALRAEATSRLQQQGLMLTAEEWSLMMILWQDGPQTMTALARLTSRDRTTVTRLIDRLTRKELVDRQARAGDRRVVQIAATDKGQELRDPVTRIIGGVIRDTCGDLDPAEYETTLLVLQRMTARLEGDVPQA